MYACVCIYAWVYMPVCMLEGKTSSSAEEEFQLPVGMRLAWVTWVSVSRAFHGHSGIGRCSVSCQPLPSPSWSHCEMLLGIPEKGTWKLMSSCVKLGVLLLGGRAKESPLARKLGGYSRVAQLLRTLETLSCPVLSSLCVKAKSANAGDLEKNGMCGEVEVGPSDSWDSLLLAGLSLDHGYK